MIVLGITGPIGSGKDAVSDYLQENHGFKTFSCGDVIRRIADEEDVEPNRENLQIIGKKYRRKRGEGFLAGKAADIIKESKTEKIAVSGLRNPEEIERLREEFGDSFKLVHVHASKKTRFRRLGKRGRTGDPTDYEDFLQQDTSEKKKFNMNSTFSMADIKINNEDTLEKLYGRIDKLVKGLKE